MTQFSESSLHGLVTKEQAAARCRIEKIRHGASVFTNGVFDILHRGHLEYLGAAREYGQVLIVGLNSDESVRRLKGSHRPINNEDDRAFALLALNCVDCVVIFDEDTPQKLIEILSPDILVKGGDYKVESIVGYDHVISTGGKVLSLPLHEGYSTTGFIDRIIKAYSK